MEAVRQRAADFIGAPSSDNLIFTKGATESINLVAHSYLKPRVNPGDEIIVTEMEHHANLVPWQLLAESLSLTIKVWPINEMGELDCNDLESLINPNTCFLAVTHVSNVLGTVNPVEAYIELAHQYQIPVLVDGAQAVMHYALDVQTLDCDFYVFSGHKLYGPTGIGMLYAKPQYLDTMLPWQGGGAMIDQVVLPTGTSYGRVPWRFEAGTPNIAGIIGMGEAIAYVQKIGIGTIESYEQQLMAYLLFKLQQLDDVEIYGNPKQRAGTVSFNLVKHHAFDVGAFLDRYGVAIRTGHHCAMPLVKKLGQNAVCRVSIGMYTDASDIDALIEGLVRINQLLR